REVPGAGIQEGEEVRVGDSLARVASLAERVTYFLPHDEVLPTKRAHLADDRGGRGAGVGHAPHQLAGLRGRHADEQPAGGLGVVEELQSQRVRRTLELCVRIDVL